MSQLAFRRTPRAAPPVPAVQCRTGPAQFRPQIRRNPLTTPRGLSNLNIYGSIALYGANRAGHSRAPDI
jgi:hypothetical protein